MTQNNYETIKSFTLDEMKSFLTFIADKGHPFFETSLCKTCPHLVTDDCEKAISANDCPGTSDPVFHWLQSTNWE